MASLDVRIFSRLINIIATARAREGSLRRLGTLPALPNYSLALIFDNICCHVLPYLIIESIVWSAYYKYLLHPILFGGRSVRSFWRQPFTTNPLAELLHQPLWRRCILPRNPRKTRGIASCGTALQLPPAQASSLELLCRGEQSPWIRTWQ
jgi:hypothetical protein